VNPKLSSGRLSQIVLAAAVTGGRIWPNLMRSNLLWIPSGQGFGLQYKIATPQKTPNLLYSFLVALNLAPSYFPLHIIQL
jgi:hypothetical protein